MAASSPPQAESIPPHNDEGDDIYSEQDGNESSLGPGSEALGPSDGYFHASPEEGHDSRAVDGEANQPREWRYGPAADTPRVPNILVEDPTPSIQQARNKRQEAERERRAVEQYTSPVQSPATASQPPALPSIETQYQQSTASSARAGPRHTDAPPAYSPAQQQQQSQASSSWSEPENAGSSNTYGTMASGSVTSPEITRPPTSVADEEQQPLLESDDDSLYRHRTSSSAHSRRSRRRKTYGMPIKYIRVLAVLVMLVVILTFVLLFELIKTNQPPESVDYADTTPIRKPAPDLPLLQWNPPIEKKCKQSHGPVTITNFPFPMEASKDYLFAQLKDVNSLEGTLIESFGNIYIQPAPRGWRASVRVDSVSNDKRISYQWTKHTTAIKDTIRVAHPAYIKGWDARGGAPCVQTQIILYIPEDTVVSTLEVSSASVDIVVQNGTSLRARKQIELGSGLGSVLTPTLSGYENGVEPYRLQAPKLTIVPLYGNARGWFPLYDKTEFGIGVGSIQAQIQPKASREKSASISELSMDCGIGNISVTQFWGNDSESNAWTRELPVRQYNADINTLQGSISADVLVTNSAKMTAKTGNLDFVLRPLFLANRKTPQLDIWTELSSGATTGVVQDPIWATSSTFKLPTASQKRDHEKSATQRDYTMFSRHVSFPEDSSFTYPLSWSGSTQYHSVTPGHMNVRNGVVEIVRNGEAGGLVYMETVKGKGNSDMRLDVASGVTNLCFNSCD